MHQLRKLPLRHHNVFGGVLGAILLSVFMVLLFVRAANAQLDDTKNSESYLVEETIKVIPAVPVDVTDVIGSGGPANAKNVETEKSGLVEHPRSQKTDVQRDQEGVEETQEDGELAAEDAVTDNPSPQEKKQEKNAEPESNGVTSFANIIKRSEDDLLILNLNLGSMTLLDGLLVYEDLDTEKYYIPLLDFVDALEFPIEISDDSKAAQGWFLDESNGFELSLENGQVNINGKAYSLKAGEIERHEDGIYVSLEQLEKWFPVTLDLNFSELSIDIKSLKPLPIEIALARDEKRALIKTGKDSAAPVYPLETEPAPRFTLPIVSTSVQTKYEKVEGIKNPFGLDYSVLATGQFMGQDLEFSVNDATNNGTPASMRATLSRKSSETDLLGFVGATEYAFGDIVTQQIPIIAKSNVGRGAYLSTMPLDFKNRGRGNSITLRGDLQTGYQVDVMRNGQLLGFVEEPDENGEYVFDDVLALPGLNVFELVFYGPQGQKEVKEERIFIPYKPVEKGKFDFRSFVIQDQTNLLNDRVTTDDDTGEVRLITEANYGLTETSSLYAAAASYSDEGQRKNYGLLGYSFSFKGVRTDFNYAKSAQDGNAFGVNFQSFFKGLQWQAAHTEFRDFVSEDTQDSGVSSQLKSETKARLAGILPFKLLSNVPFTLSFKRFKGVNKETLNEYTLRITRNIKKIRLTSEYNKQTKTGQEDDENLVFQVNSRLQDVSLRGQANYDLSPESGLSNLSFTADWKYDPKTNVRFGVARSGLDEPIHSINTGISRDVGFANVGLSFNYDDTDNFTALFSAKFSMFYNPKKKRISYTSKSLDNTGALAQTVFLDENNNGMYDEGDAWLPDVGFEGSGIKPEEQTDDDGYLMLTGLRAYERNKVGLDEATLPDPFMKTTVGKKDYVVRPGQVMERTIPVVRVGEIDGQIDILRNKRRKPGTSFILEIVDENQTLIAQAKSEFDGYVLVQDVPIGKHTARIQPAQLEELGYCKTNEQTVELTAEESFTSIEGFVLQPQLRGDDEEEFGLVLAQGIKKQEIIDKQFTFALEYPDVVEDRDLLVFDKIGAEEEQGDEQGDKDLSLISSDLDYDLVVGPFTEDEARSACSDIKDIFPRCKVQAWAPCPSRAYVHFDAFESRSSAITPATDEDGDGFYDLKVKDLSTEEEILQIIDNRN